MQNSTEQHKLWKDTLVSDIKHISGFKGWFFNTFILDDRVLFMQGDDVPPAGVFLERDNNNKLVYKLLINPDKYFCHKVSGGRFPINTISDPEVYRVDILLHEFTHVVLNHCIRKLKLINKDPYFDDNIFALACDIIVNSSPQLKKTQLGNSPRYVNFQFFLNRYPNIFKNKQQFNHLAYNYSLEAIYYFLKRVIKDQNNDDNSLSKEHKFVNDSALKKNTSTRYNEQDDEGDDETSNASNTGETSEYTSDVENKVKDEPNGNNNSSESNTSEEVSDDSQGLSGKDIEDLIQEISEFHDSIAKRYADSISLDKVNSKDIEDDFKRYSGGFCSNPSFDIIRYIKDKNIIIKPSNKWMKIIGNRKKSVYDFTELEVWGAKTRKNILLDSKFLLPAEKDSIFDQTKKPVIHTFMDISGSCAEVSDHFCNILNTIPSCLALNCYVFNTQVGDTWDPRASNRTLKPSGGTDFNCILNKCIEIESVSGELPETVVIITDGQAIGMDLRRFFPYHAINDLELSGKTSKYYNRYLKIMKHVLSWYWIYFGNEVIYKNLKGYNIVFPYNQDRVIHLREFLYDKPRWLGDLQDNSDITPYTDSVKTQDFRFNSKLVDYSNPLLYLPLRGF